MNVNVRVLLERDGRREAGDAGADDGDSELGLFGHDVW